MKETQKCYKACDEKLDENFSKSDFYFPFSTGILPSRKSKKEILYLLETETGKLKTDGEDGLQEGLSDLFHRRNIKAKNN